MQDENSSPVRHWLPGAEFAESIDSETATSLEGTALVNKRGYRIQIPAADESLIHLSFEQAHQFDPESRSWSDWEEQEAETVASLEELLLVIANWAAELGSHSALSPSELAALIRTFSR